MIEETNEFYEEFYTEENLANHVAYISDRRPGRLSYAFAVSRAQYLAPWLPSIELSKYNYPSLTQAQTIAHALMRIDPNCRSLFNIQFYEGDSTPVPRHNDGELLDYETTEDGDLKIKKSIRPELVSVLVLQNENTFGGTRLFTPDALNGKVVHCKKGDLLIFDNLNCDHAVDTLAKPRTTIGWRSLSENCFLATEGVKKRLSLAEVNALMSDWLEKEWPSKWEKLKAEFKAPF